MSAQSCPTNENLKAYLNDTLVDEQAQLVDQHVNQCKKCQQRLGSHNLLSGIPSSALSAIRVEGTPESAEESRLVEKLSQLDIGILNSKPATAAGSKPAKRKVPTWFLSLLGLKNAKPLASLETSNISFDERYLLTKVLGWSAMSVVVSAKDSRLNREVVIKVPAPELWNSNDRFLEEVRVVAELEHPNIVSVFDIGSFNDHPYVICNRIEGETLAQRLKRDGKLDSKEALRITGQVASALQYAHQHDVYHRDVKPTNIMIDNQGSAFLLDFGLAVRDSNVETEQHFFAGTLPYMAPEQISADAGPLDGRVDVYGLGVVLYECVAGRRPFVSDSDKQLHQHILSKPVRPVRQIDGTISQTIEDICERCLQKRPEDRFQSAAHLNDALSSAMAEPFDAPASTRETFQRELYSSAPAQPVKSDPVRAGAGWMSPLVLIPLALLVLGGITAWQFWPPRTPITNLPESTSVETTMPESSVPESSVPEDNAPEDNAPMSGDTEPDRPPARSLRSVDSFFYMLQADAENRTRAGVLEQLRNCDADLLIIDVSFDGSEESRWSPGELRSIAEGKRGRKILAYFSVGEAEDFRAYWREDWDRNRDGKPDAAAPEFLQLANEDWAGSYNVKFWDAEWKTIIFQDLDSIIARGFDGIFLDRVDAFEDQEQTESGEYESGRINPQSNQSFRNDMLDFIYSLAGRARTQSRDFLIVPQNGTQLLDDPRYVELIDGITLEELLFFDNAPSDAEERVKVLERVSRLSDQKPVLLVEYVRPEFRDECLAKAKELGFKILITDRDLETFDAIK